MVPPCHSYALTRRFLPSKNRFASICNTDITLQCKTFMVIRVLNDENDLLSSAISPDQRAPYSSLESQIRDKIKIIQNSTKDKSSKTIQQSR
uniref:Uncharacterized protein n=1 Tax=Ixodes ricinus TaxID=34613 RepID=A0A6B0U1K1_IXORI